LNCFDLTNGFCHFNYSHKDTITYEELTYQSEIMIMSSKMIAVVIYDRKSGLRKYARFQRENLT